MALGNFIVSGSYTTVEISLLDKQNKRIVLTTKTYSDSSKVNLITAMQFSTNAYDAPVAKDKDLDDPSGLTPTDGDTYLVPSGAVNDWSGKDGQVLKWSDAISDWEYDNSEVLFFEDESLTYRKVSGSWSVDTGRIDGRTYDSYFSVTAMDVEGNNILKLAYEYLKTRAEFSSCTDV